MNQRTTFRLAILHVLVFASLGGCEWKGGPFAATPATQPAELFHIAPRTLRVYPTSRFVLENGKTLLEARVELLDEMEDSTKAVGDFHVELLAAGKAGGASVGQRLYSWDVSVLTITDQKRFYDRISRAYLFRLSLDDATPPRRDTLLKVVYMPAAGPRLEAQTIFQAGESP